MATDIQVPVGDESFERIADYQDTLMTQLVHVILVYLNRENYLIGDDLIKECWSHC